MPKIMTAEQAFNVSMNEYPSLYASTTLDKAKMKFYDHVFNVIGNGWRDMEEFKKEHTINKHNKHLVDSFPEKYIGDTPLFTAYTEVKYYGNYKEGIFDSSLLGIYTQEEIAQMPEVKHSVRIDRRRKENENMEIDFYPNFQKRYSMVWDDISSLDKSWFEAAKFFYTNAKEYFTSNNTHNYSNACPKDDDIQKWDRLIADYERHFPQYVKEGQTQQEYFDKITQDYGTPYYGDTKQFIKERRAKELVRINSFLDETLERLDGYLKLDNTSVKKTGMRK